MKCPNCNKPPISIINFILRASPKKIHCINCGVKLKYGKLLKVLYFSALAFGLVLGLSTAHLENIYSWSFQTSMLIFFTVFAIVALPMEYFAWKHGRFEEDVDK